ncbi:hypothetical protein [Solibacillus merdavium]|uniref:Uncharacterized protein n=1 Tax=Solibacillus merdavium TaxID=2762218 RepID=A0ABR8XK79_9BACL|nr:hypothetical protein [Solibacillus merdavium]MBD8032342.1 hypothetical protein [Solibacillus merdavium]
MFILFLIVAILCIFPIVALYYWGGDSGKPSKLSYLLLCLTIAIWTSFLTGVFTLLPDRLANVLWEGSWIGILILGFIAFLYEFKKNKAYAFSALIICFINGSFYMFAKFISSM